MLRFFFCLAALICATAAHAQTVALPNGDFETAAPNAATRPAGWTAGGEGEGVWEQSGRDNSRAIGVRNGRDDQSVFWKSDMALEPNTLYRLQFWSKGAGSIISGANVANKDFAATPQWSLFRTVFATPADTKNAYLRLGQWNGGGALWFDDAKLTRVQPLFTGSGSTPTLGAGEIIAGGKYRFDAPLAQSNFTRPLEFFTAGFNSNRWVLGADAQIVYRHRIGDFAQNAARVRASIGYYRGGKLLVEASRDGKEWTPLGTLEKMGEIAVEVPPSLLPAREVWIRLRAAAPPRGAQDSSPGSFQINAYHYEADVPGAPDARGQTRFLEETVSPPDSFAAHVETLGALSPGAGNVARLKVASREANTAPAQLVFSLQHENAAPQNFEKTVSISPGENVLELPYDLRSAGEYTAQVALRANGKTLFAATTEFSVPALYAADYGYRIGDFEDVWWSEADRKISRERPLPAAAGSTPTARAGVQISAAKNEYEPFQVVARPAQNVRGVRVSATELKTENGAVIATDDIEICEVAYVDVAQPTDATGVAGAWPDPLPPHRAPLDLAAGQNQPFWITVHVPKTARAGVYRGEIRMAAANWKRTIPVQLTVRDFALADETHVQSGFGLNASRVRRYHNVSSPADVARVMEKYYANFAAHRIAPYAPAQNARIAVDWGLSGASDWRGGAVDGSTPFAGHFALKVADEKTDASIGAEYGKNIPVAAGQKYAFQFAVKTALPQQEYLVTLNTYDAAGQWISGNNLDWKRAGSGAWENVTLDAGARLAKSPKADQVASVRVSLRPVPWSEAGEKTGMAWFDNVQLLNEKNQNLIEGGDFEPAPVAAEQVKLDFSAFDAAMTRALDQYRFTAFRLPIEGMGSGTFHARTPGRIGTFEEGTPQYETLFGSYLRQLQAHLAQKGWLDKAYVYWFDEPDEKDYPFVRAGMERLRKYAPKIRRLLTEQPEPALFGAVNLWCPVTSHFDENSARERMQAGDEFWWYICTVPKAPYATEFIDHAAVEPRVWLWQTWQQNVRGILIWETTYWTSDAAYPNALQNPWQDPMSWVSGYDTPAGVRRAWGNGDGRFLYPPNRHPNEDKTPNFEAPINSIRWELLREGIEDYEYLWTLREAMERARPHAKTAAQKTLLASAEKLLIVPPEISRALTDFTASPAPILHRREAIANAIEALQKIAR